MSEINIFTKIIATIIAALCFCNSAFAADVTQISNKSSFINESGAVGSYIDLSSIENISTSYGGSDHITSIKNEDLTANLGGYIGSIVKAGSTKSISTSVGGDSIHIIENIKEAYNSGIIDNFVDISDTYSDALSIK